MNVLLYSLDTFCTIGTFSSPPTVSFNFYELQYINLKICFTPQLSVGKYLVHVFFFFFFFLFHDNILPECACYYKVM